MLTNSFSFWRHRRSVASVHRQQRASTGLSTQLNQVYHELAQASGGQAIEVTKGTLDQATGIIADISSSTLVNTEILNYKKYSSIMLGHPGNFFWHCNYHLD